MTASAVAFSPVPVHQVAIPFPGSGSEGPWSPLTFLACPLRVLWEQNYRAAALAVAIGDVDEARVLARRGLAMENAYIERVRAEAKQVMA